MAVSLVGAKGFEPSTPWSQTRCATGLRYTPSAAKVRLLGGNLRAAHIPHRNLRHAVRNHPVQPFPKKRPIRLLQPRFSPKNNTPTCAGRGVLR